MIQVNDDAQTVTSSLSLPEQSTIPIRHLLYRTSRTQFPKSRSKQLTPETNANPSNPMPESSLVEATSSDHSSIDELSNTTPSTLPSPIPEYTIFDPLKRLPHYPTYDLRPIGFSYQPERWYPEAEFRMFWNYPTVDITDRLIPRESSVALQCDFPSTVHIEGEFDGIPIRLKLDPLRSTDLEPFQRGTVISYKESNDAGKYMVECCQLVREGVAYLKVVYRTSSQAVFPAYDEKRPAFILSIPAQLNAAPSPPFPSTMSNDPTLHQPHSPYPYYSNKPRTRNAHLSIRARCRILLSTLVPCIDI
jgi:hypothetical protein